MKVMPAVNRCRPIIRSWSTWRPLSATVHSASPSMCERMDRWPNCCNRVKKLYRTRYGLIDMACYQCHDVYPGQMIRGQKISQGQGNGFPAYRLDTGEITSLNQRIRQCLSLMRAEPFDADSEENKLLELYIMSRSNGLRIETPAVRY